MWVRQAAYTVVEGFPLAHLENFICLSAMVSARWWQRGVYLSNYTIKVTYTGEPIDKEHLARLVFESLLEANQLHTPSGAPEPQREEHTIA